MINGEFEDMPRKRCAKTIMGHFSEVLKATKKLEELMGEASEERCAHELCVEAGTRPLDDGRKICELHFEKIYSYEE